MPETNTPGCPPRVVNLKKVLSGTQFSRRKEQDPQHTHTHTQNPCERVLYHRSLPDKASAQRDSLSHTAKGVLEVITVGIVDDLLASVRSFIILQWHTSLP